ncbi:MAG: beta-glucosidase, partial [Bacteriovoracaceae bacterium]|nr:beta-glucosidase [Bacteriovoracaceae bacterium]
MKKPFFWGVANSAFQVEGSPAESDWKKWTRETGKIKDSSNADIACDFWNRFEEDFDLAQKIGCTAFRISIAWDRIQPTPSTWDEKALDHYEKIIISMRKRGLEPWVTLHHFVLPEWLAKEGGLLAKDFVQHFISYSEKVVRRLSKSPATVKYWMTFNEPNVLARGGYLVAEWPPGFRDRMDLAVESLAQMAEAHIRSVTALSDLNVLFGVAHHVRPLHGKGFNPLNSALAWMLDSIFNRHFIDSLGGNIYFWAPGVKSIKRKIPNAKPLDFLGINYYGRLLVSASIKPPFFNITEGPGEKTDLGWEIFPEGLFELTKKLYRRYKIPIIITENGLADQNDSKRSKFIQDHIFQIERARKADIPIEGYFHWSLTDNFEWAEGLSSRFGLIGIDYAKDLKRFARPSLAQ